MTFQQVLQKYRDISFSERDKGARFERLMRAFLQTVPWYEGKFTKVWLWHDFPYKGEQLGGKDTGIDLVAKTVDREFWAIQCKCFDENAYINKAAVDSFLATSSKDFVDDKGETTQFAKRLWISTTNKWGSEAEKAINFQNPEVIRLNLTDLINAPVDWEALENGVHGEKARQPKKKPREHQTTAINAFSQYFTEGNDRGKLIMACGTGKTYTSLKIAEKETGGKGLVLFLAPSISLVGQTLREWTTESEKNIWPVCVCSDPTISQQTDRDEDTDSDKIIDLAWPASTDPANIANQVKLAEKYHKDGLIVIFSTYQSIDVVAKAQKKFTREFDLIICDEAHRTTGVTLKDEDESAFVKVHDNSFIKAKRRLYMTATPRLYHSSAKKKAQDNDAVLCSMDDPKLYGDEVYRIGFGEAVDKNLLADYKVLVLTLTQDDIPEDIQIAIADKNVQINTDDASKLIGCINALSKRMLIDEGLLKSSDPQPMRKAVAFCQTINKSKAIKNIFNAYKDEYYASLPVSERSDIVQISSDHIDGTMGATKRTDLLDWLNASPSDGNECRILNNVRCLSEGVDVPSLDAVLFLSARDSHIDVVQSVGRVMRTAPNKKFGYIIIPVLVPKDKEPNEILDDNDTFKVVWTVLNALRAHDDRFDATIKKIELNKHKPNGGGSILVGGIGRKKLTDNGNSGDGKPGPVIFPFDKIKDLQNAVYARMVIKVGNRKYWEQWAAEVAQIAQRYTERINRLIAKPGAHQEAFNKFLTELQKNINPSVTPDQVVEMLSQHYITKPVFEALFENYSFVKENPVSKALEDMIDLLEEQALEKDTIALSRFYESVKNSVSRIDNAPARQKIITELYDKFFRTAFPLTVQKLGIVYTPVEIVDFINYSVADILNSTFGRSLSDKDVNVLDPFAGTGTFLARMIESGLIEKEALTRKYEEELFANEIILLAYYIASINIENAYHTAMGEETPYKPFNGICLTDTFQLGEQENQQHELPGTFLKRNSERVEREMAKQIQVIIGNPPYSVGQRSANDNAQNQEYPHLRKIISESYGKISEAKLKTALYDSYIKAFRWASDRIDKEKGGIIAFVSNAGWLDGNAMDGMRKYLEQEFSEIFVYNLRGNCRTSGEQRKKEAGNVFGLGSRTPISITILVKNPSHDGKAVIHYKDIGDYLSREEKLEIVAKMGSVQSDQMAWQMLVPDGKGDWLNQGNNLFDTFIQISTKSDKNIKKMFFKSIYSCGIKTNRDSWCYNFSKKYLIAKISEAIIFFNNEVERIGKLDYINNDNIDNYIDKNPKNFSWDLKQKLDILKHKKYNFDDNSIRISLYRPFNKEWCYYNKELNNSIYLIPKLFPTDKLSNLVICVSGIGSNKYFSVLISNEIPNMDSIEKSQCFPLYYYERKSHINPTLFDSSKKDEYTRHNAITDFILERCQENYGKKVTKEDIFYYVYGLLHSPDYRRTFANDLKKSLPRLPLVGKPADFWAFSNAGKDLADLHLNYENQPPCEDVIVTGVESGNFHVDKMRFPNKEDKSVIQYNSDIAISNIPLEAYEYAVNGRSAIEWIMERYQIKVDKASGIVNDPNDWANEHGKPKYILDLLLSIITISLKTIKIVHGLPKLILS